MALLLHGEFQSKDLAALIYDLAQRGYLHIIQQKDILILRTSKTTNLSEHEKILLQLLTPDPVKPNHLQETLANLNQEMFSALVSNLYLEAYESSRSLGLFKDSLRQLHLQFKTGGILLQLLSIIILVVTALLSLQRDFPGVMVAAFASFLVGVLIYQAGYRIIPLTEKGQQTRQACLAFANFLGSPKPFSDTEGQQGFLFFNYLPYSLVANQENNWLQRFRTVSFYIPEWFTDSSEDLLTVDKFLLHLDELITTIAKNFSNLKDPNAD